MEIYNHLKNLLLEDYISENVGLIFFWLLLFLHQPKKKKLWQEYSETLLSVLKLYIFVVSSVNFYLQIFMSLIKIKLDTFPFNGRT